ncbi:UDP-N-acetylglucosamine pyrophosphorylase [Ascosphaera aggregata]|nr:UDP-N-acetylglucosamine pyrophosphorylase [Ascosphaera aggregata]
MVSTDLQALKEKYASAGQDQVFTYFDTLSETEQSALISQLTKFDPHRINDLVTKVLNPPVEADNPDSSRVVLEPLPDQATASLLEADHETTQAWYDAGLELIAQAKVAVVLMAGGQGTRLGSSAPKGCFDIGLPSKKSLFQIQAERIHKLQQLAKKYNGDTTDVVIPWYVMTSGPTRGPTEKFFKENDYFGLNAKDVIIFEQGVLPCISNEGKILMESKGKVAVAPDGNGGIYQALVTSGARADMHARGIEHIHAYCVDNCLVKVADPIFIGFSSSKKVDIATKVVRKRNATESVGLIVSKNGKPGVVEYSEIDKETAEAEDEERPGVLKFRAANIVNHYYSIGFLDSVEQWASQLEHHIARKKIPHLDTTTGETVKPTKPNGIKFEQFVFDVFPMLDLEKFACIEVRREDEFSPLKNARGTGEDDPDTSRADIMKQGARWVKAAGGQAGELAEVSPLVSYGGEGMEFVSGKTVEEGSYIKEKF